MRLPPHVAKKKPNLYEILCHSGIKMTDRPALLVFVSDWLRLQAPVKYALGKLSAELGTNNGFMRGCLRRLKEGGWLVYDSQQGVKRYGVTVALTQQTLKTFKLPLPRIRIADIQFSGSLKVLSIPGNKRPEHRKLKPPLLRRYINSLHKQSFRKQEVYGVKSIKSEPLHEVRKLVDYFETEYLQKMNYTPNARYTPALMSGEAEILLAIRPFEKWVPCIDWVRQVKKGLAKDEFIQRLKVYKLLTIKTCWNHFQDALAEGRVPGVLGQSGAPDSASAYDNGRRN